MGKLELIKKALRSRWLVGEFLSHLATKLPPDITPRRSPLPGLFLALRK
jgi:hypothetical protein